MEKSETDNKLEKIPKKNKTSGITAPTQYQKIWQFLNRKPVVVAGEKGGGNAKSFTTDKFVSYLTHIGKHKPFYLYDCDRSNPTTWLVYNQQRKVETSVSFTEDKDNNSLGDELVERLAEDEARLLLDTPSQFFRGFDHAYFEGGLNDCAKMYGFSFIFLYVSPPDRYTLDQFSKVLSRFGIEHISWVLVKNLFRSSKQDWEELLREKSLSTALKKHNVVEMYLPELKRPEITLIERQKLSLDRAFDAVNLCGKARLLRYQQEVFTEFESAFLSLIEQNE